MTIQEFYDRIGGGYEDAMALMRKEERVRKYLGMFLKDETFAALEQAMGADDMEAAFTAAHTLKGVTANLSLTRLQQLSSALTEDLRYGRDLPHAREAFPEVAACYRETTEAIRQLLSDGQ